MAVQTAYTIEMIVQGMPDRLRQQYDDEAACNTAMNQLKTASGTVTFGQWEIKADQIVAYRKVVVKSQA